MERQNYRTASLKIPVHARLGKRNPLVKIQESLYSDVSENRVSSLIDEIKNLTDLDKFTPEKVINNNEIKYLKPSVINLEDDVAQNIKGRKSQKKISRITEENTPVVSLDIGNDVLSDLEEDSLASKLNYTKEGKDIDINSKSENTGKKSNSKHRRKIVFDLESNDEFSLHNKNISISGKKNIRATSGNITKATNYGLFNKNYVKAGMNNIQKDDNIPGFNYAERKQKTYRSSYSKLLKAFTNEVKEKTLQSSLTRDLFKSGDKYDHAYLLVPSMFHHLLIESDNVTQITYDCESLSDNSVQNLLMKLYPRRSNSACFIVPGFKYICEVEKSLLCKREHCHEILQIVELSPETELQFVVGEKRDNFLKFIQSLRRSNMPTFPLPFLPFIVYCNETNSHSYLHKIFDTTDCLLSTLQKTSLDMFLQELMPFWITSLKYFYDSLRINVEDFLTEVSENAETIYKATTSSRLYMYVNDDAWLMFKKNILNIMGSSGLKLKGRVNTSKLFGNVSTPELSERETSSKVSGLASRLIDETHDCDLKIWSVTRLPSIFIERVINVIDDDSQTKANNYCIVAKMSKEKANILGNLLNNTRLGFAKIKAKSFSKNKGQIDERELRETRRVLNHGFNFSKKVIYKESADIVIDSLNLDQEYPFDHIFTQMWKNCIFYGLEYTPKLVYGILKNLPNLGEENRRGVSALVITASPIYAEFLQLWTSTMSQQGNKLMASCSIASRTSMRETDIIFGSIEKFMDIPTNWLKMFRHVSMVILDDVKEIMRSKESAQNLYMLLKNLKRVTDFDNVDIAIVAEEYSVKLAKHVAKFINCQLYEFNNPKVSIKLSKCVNEISGVKKFEHGVMYGRGEKRKNSGIHYANKKQPRIGKSASYSQGARQYKSFETLQSAPIVTKNTEQFTNYGKAPQQQLQRQSGIKSSNYNALTPEEIEKYLETPKLHNDYPVQYQMFLSENPNVRPNNVSTQLKWDRFWKNYLSKCTRSDGAAHVLSNTAKIHNNNLISSFIDKNSGRIHPNKLASSTIDKDSGIVHPNINVTSSPGESKVFDILILLSNFSKNIIYLGKSLSDLIVKSLEIGPTDHEKILTFLSQVSNLRTLQEAAASINTVRSVAPANKQSIYNLVYDKISKLIRDLKLRSDSSAFSDLDKIAKATLGKDVMYIKQMLKNYLKYKGRTDPSANLINELYLEICSVHFRMSTGTFLK